MAYCEARPLEELHITWDGHVAPCVYLTLPLKGDSLTKVYEGEIYRVPVNPIWQRQRKRNYGNMA